MKNRLLCILLIFAALLSLTFTVSAEEEWLIYDEAQLLSSSEAENVNDRLVALGEEYDVNICIVTLESTDGEDVEDVADDIYEELELDDGILVLVSMDPRRCQIVTDGRGGEAIDEDAIEEIGNAMKSDLSDEEYEDAFLTFVDKCEYYLDGYENGFPFDGSGSLATAVIVGVIVAFITVMILKGQLKSIHMQNQANNYVKPGSMQLTVRNDLFLYRTIDRRKKESKSSGSSNSSGSSRNSGGVSF